MSAIRGWLEGLGLGQHADAFEREDIDLDALRRLSDDDLKELGLTMGPRRKVLAAIDELAPAVEPKAPTAPRAAERRQLTVMFCDLVGSTALSEKLDPEDLREVMAAYQKAAGTVIERYEGHVAQYLGDGLMTYFGWPTAHEDDAQRAVQAGLDIVEAVGALAAPVPLSVRVGISTGPVVVGETGDGDASVPKAAIGETPNLAARVQGLAAPNTVTIGDATRRLIGGAFDLEDLGAQDLKGIAAPVALFRVICTSDVESRFDASRGANLTPLVGRDEEVGLLFKRWEQAKDGEGQVVLLSGEAGIGKSRITQALRERIGGDPHIRLRYQCSPYHTNSAFYPVIAQFERAAGFVRDDTPEARLDKLEALLAQSTEPVGDVAPLFAALLSLPLDRSPPLNLSPQKQKENTIAALANQVALLAHRQPVLMIFEDAHWIDPTTLEVLGAMIERVRESAVLVVITFRPEFEPPWAGHGHIAALTLNRLSRREGTDMVAKVTGGKALPIEVLDQIVAKTDGVPLFVEELTKTVLEAGFLKDSGVAYTLDGPLPPLAIPATLQDSLMARLDRLAAVKEVAQIGACIGREFGHELLAAVSPLGENELDDALQQLVNSALVFRTGSAPNAIYTFKHALVQDAAYDSLLKSRRVEIHQRLGETIETKLSTFGAANPELVAHHFTTANIPDRAIPYWLTAGQKAISRLAFQEAIAQLKSGLDLIDLLPKGTERDRLELNIRAALATASLATFGWASAEVLRIVTDSLDVARRVADFPRLYFFLHYQAVVLSNRCEFQASSPIIEEMITISRSESLGDLSVMASSFSSAYYTWIGKFERADELSNHVEKYYRSESHSRFVEIFNHDPMCFSQSWKSQRLWMQGYPDRARSVALEQVDRARSLRHPFNLIWALTGGCAPFFHCGEGGKYCEFVAEARKTADEQGLSFLDDIVCSFWNGMGLIVDEKYEEGYRELNKGNQLWRDGGGLILFDLVHFMMAQALRFLGDTQRAISLIEEAIALVDRTGHAMHEPEVHRVRGELLLLGGSPNLAIATASFQKAIEVAQSNEARSWELRAATSLARLWQSENRSHEAYDLLAPVYDWFTEGFESADLRDAKALLESLR